MRVAAAHLARRLLEHEHALGAVLLGRDRGGQSRIAGADDDDVVFLHDAFPMNDDAAARGSGALLPELL